MNAIFSITGPTSSLPTLPRTMNNLNRFIDRIANWKTLILLLTVYVSFPAYWFKNAGATINQLAGKAIDPIDLTFGFNPARTLRMVADYGPAARAYYTRIELTTDLLYPIVYSLLLAVVLTLLFRRKSYKPFSWVALLPFVGMFFDYLENATIVGMLNHFPGQSYPLAALCEIFKMGKFLIFGLSMALILYGLVRLILGKRQVSFRG